MSLNIKECFIKDIMFNPQKKHNILMHKRHTKHLPIFTYHNKNNNISTNK